MIRLRELNQAEVEIFMLPEHLNQHPTFSHVEGFKLNLLSKQAQVDKKDTTPMTAGEAVKKGIIANQWMAYHLVKAVQIYLRLGVKLENMRCRQHMDTERAHYSKDCWDLEILTDYGWVEVIGNAYRTDFDLSQHIKLSGADLSVVDEKNNKIVPHVVEPSYGIDRMFYVTLEHALRTEGERTWMALPYEIAPVKAWILPIVKDPALDPLCEGIKGALIEKGFVAWIMEKASVGKRYARADEAGVPACITLDRQTQEDGTVTIRERDSKKQVRVKASELPQKLEKMLSGADFSGLGTPVVAAPAKE
jgi:glycyl-tRNA synthetase